MTFTDICQTLGLIILSVAVVITNKTLTSLIKHVYREDRLSD